MKKIQINIKKISSKNWKSFLPAIAGFVIFIICNICIKNSDISYITRPGVGDSTEMEIAVEGLTDEVQNLEIPISGRVYSQEEAKEAFALGMDSLIETLPGKNQSLQNITSKINPVSEIRDLGLKVKWDFANTDLLDASGNVYNENLTQSVDLNLEVILSDGIRKETYIVPIRICPKEMSESERLVKGLLDYIKVIDESDRENEGYSLPKTFSGRQIMYRSTNRSNFHLIWIIGIIIAILLYLREKKNKQRAMEYRQSSLLKDYPDIVSKLMIFIGAGLSIRQALEGIVSDYEGEGERRYAYEELAIAVDKLKNGVHESLVYKELGRVCALRQYMKLSSLLEQNRRSGLANLSSLLEIESQSAWDERINLARREGEELSTKLLIPLFIMLVVVMMIIIVPALLTFY